MDKKVLEKYSDEAYQEWLGRPVLIRIFHILFGLLIVLPYVTIYNFIWKLRH